MNSDTILTEIKKHKHISPYGMGKLLNVPPQMMYNYIRQGRIAATLNSTGKKQISQSEALRFATEYLERKAERQKNK